MKSAYRRHRAAGAPPPCNGTSGLLQELVSGSELMARLGHATPAAALIYLHARTDGDTALAVALGDAMASASRQSADAD